MKICTACGNKLMENEKKCAVCKTKAKDFPVVADEDTEKAKEIIEAVKTRNMGKKDMTVKKKKGKGCLITIIAIIAIGVIGGIMSSGDNTQDVDVSLNKTPIAITADQLIADLNQNPLNASNLYKGEYVKVTGKLSNIDSSGSYFSIGKLDDSFTLDTIMCYIKEEHLETVSNLTKNQEVTVVGIMTSVGEVLGYSLDVDYIE